MSRLLAKLDLPVNWVTPNGLKITQNYNSYKSLKLAINILGRRQTIRAPQRKTRQIR